MTEAARSLVIHEQQANFNERQTRSEKMTALHVSYI